MASAARDTAKLGRLAAETDAKAFAVDALDPGAVERLFGEVEAAIGIPEVVVYNANGRLPGPIETLDPEGVREARDLDIRRLSRRPGG